MARVKKKGAAKKSGAASNDQLKKVKAQLAELKKKAAAEKKEFSMKLKKQKIEMTAKINDSVASAYAAGYDKALSDTKKLNAARDKAVNVAAKKFDSKNALKAPSVKKSKKTKAKKAASKRGRPSKKATSSKIDSHSSSSTDSMAA